MEHKAEFSLREIDGRKAGSEGYSFITACYIFYSVPSPIAQSDIWDQVCRISRRVTINSVLGSENPADVLAV